MSQRRFVANYFECPRSTVAYSENGGKAVSAHGPELKANALKGAQKDFHLGKWRQNRRQNGPAADGLSALGDGGFP